MSNPPAWRDVIARALGAIAVLVATGSLVVAITLTDDDGDGRPDSVTFRVNDTPAPADQGVPATDVKVPEPAVAQAAATLESDLRQERPQEAVLGAPDQLEQIEDVATQVKATETPLPTAGAASSVPGCVTRFVSNQSSRQGVRPIWMVLHYTVSPNRPGWSDVNAVVALFDRSSSQASSHFVIDAEGNCAYIVPIEAKSWTEAAGNRLGVSWEVINSGREASFMDTAGYSKLRSTMAWVSQKTEIPMKAGSVYPAKAGIVQHKDGLLPWGGHIDITPYSKSQVIATITANACDTECRARARGLDLRRRNYATHQELRRRHCAPIDRTRSDRCLFLHRRHRAIHAAARHEHISL